MVRNSFKFLTLALAASITVAPVSAVDWNSHSTRWGLAGLGVAVISLAYVVCKYWFSNKSVPRQIDQSRTRLKKLVIDANSRYKTETSHQSKALISESEQISKDRQGLYQYVLAVAAAQILMNEENESLGDDLFNFKLEVKKILERLKDDELTVFVNEFYSGLSVLNFQDETQLKDHSTFKKIKAKLVVSKEEKEMLYSSVEKYAKDGSKDDNFGLIDQIVDRLKDQNRQGDPIRHYVSLILQGLQTGNSELRYLKFDLELES